MLRIVPRLIPVLIVLSVFSACSSMRHSSNKEVKNIVPDSSSAVKAVPAWVPAKSPYQPSNTLAFDLVHTRLEVSFNLSAKTLKGLAILTIKPWFYPQNTVVLDAVGFDIHSVSLLKGKKEIPLKYTYPDAEHLIVRLDTTYKKDQEFKIEIDYTAKPEEVKTKGSEAINSDKGLYFINSDGKDHDKPVQIWTQGETQSNSHWFPTFDTPNERCTQEMHITVDSSFRTISNGTLSYSSRNHDGTRTDVWEMKQPHAPYLFMMAIGKFAKVTDKWKDIEVSYYVEPAYEKYARLIFGNTPEMIGFFSDKLGVKYPWPKYSQVVVRDFVSGAMENTSATIHMEALQVDDKQLADKNWDGIIAHELFHHWFGDLVTCESWSNLPLNESFANYSEYLWDEYKYGYDEAEFNAISQLYAYLSESANYRANLIRFNYSDREKMFDSHSYAKGGLILNMLRKQVGDEAFFASLKLYLTTNKFKSVEIHNLRLAFEEVTGQDLNWFFNQWFLSAGHPELEVKPQFADGKLKVSVIQKQDSNYTPIYRLPLNLEVWADGKRFQFPVNIVKATEQFEFPIPASPDYVLLDPEKILVGTVSQTKTPSEWVAQYNHAQNVKARLEALAHLGSEPITANEKQAFISALSDPFWAMRKAALEKIADDSLTIALNKTKILELATSDKKSLVRAAALTALGKLKEESLEPVLVKALDEVPNSVNAAALGLYLKSKASELSKQDKINRFENSRNAEIISVIADYYVENRLKGHLDWFDKRIKNATSEAQYFALQYFGKYLIFLDKPDREKGVLTLEQTALTAASIYTKFGAFQALMLNDDLPGVKEKLNEIRKKETNTTLTGYYDMIMK